MASVWSFGSPTGKLARRFVQCFHQSVQQHVFVRNASSYKINQSRLMKDIHGTAQWGKGESWGSGATETGVSRLALTSADRQARDWFVETMQALSCRVDVDAMGNIFAIRAGKKAGPATFIGSHLDTQPSGGRYDGILGVTAGVESFRVLEEHDAQTEFDVGLVNWTNEEGARFPKSMVASGVWADEIPLSSAHDLEEVGKGRATMKDELQKIGYLGTTPASYRSTPMAAHFELHIEQGPILESSRQRVGSVVGVQAFRWFQITVKGRDAHTGTTPFAARSDALLTAARLIVHSHDAATQHDALASTGVLSLEPGSVNTIPGRVTFTLDIRCSDDGRLDRLEKQLREDFEQMARDEEWRSGIDQGTRGRGCIVEWMPTFASRAVKFDTECITCVEESAAALAADEGHPIEQVRKGMNSGAGHDSLWRGYIVPNFTQRLYVKTMPNGYDIHPL